MWPVDARAGTGQDLGTTTFRWVGRVEGGGWAGGGGVAGRLEGVGGVPGQDAGDATGTVSASERWQRSLMQLAGRRWNCRRHPLCPHPPLQIYNPAANTWRLVKGAPLPQGRGGMGKGVMLGGQLYVIGGESDLQGPLPEIGLTKSRVFSRVDRYNTSSGTWHAAPPMRVPRHGIFPVTDGSVVYVSGGGTKAGNSQSAAHTVFRP